MLIKRKLDVRIRKDLFFYIHILEYINKMFASLIESQVRFTILRELRLVCV